MLRRLEIKDEIFSKLENRAKQKDMTIEEYVSLLALHAERYTLDSLKKS